MMQFINKDLRNKPFFQKPYFYFVLGVVFLVLAGIFHLYDIPYKNYITTISVQNNALNIIFNIIRGFGNHLVIIILALLIGVIGRKKTCYKILCAFVIMSIIVWSLKIGVHRERPNFKNHHSFPSGDTATATVFFASLASDIPVLTPAAVVIVPFVAFLRTYDNYHYLSDVLAGIGFGLISVGFAMYFDFSQIKLLNYIKSKH